MPTGNRRSALVAPWIFPLGLLLATYPVLLLPASLQAFWPPLLALLLVFVTRRAALGLAVAGLSGVLLLCHGNPFTALQTWVAAHALPAFASPWHLGALAFTLLLGSFAAILERSGALLPLLLRSGGAPDGARRRFLSSVFGLGLLCFFDGLANSLMVGRVARPISDRLGIPRVFLAYLVDTTSSAVACIAFISTWIAMQLSLITAGISELPIDQPAYQLFLLSVPQNFYCLFALLLAFLAIRRNWLIGPMGRAKAEPPEEDPAPSTEEARLWRALVPLAILITAIPLFYYFLHRGAEVPPRFPVTLEKVNAALGSNAGPFAFVLGSALALLTAALCAPPSLFRKTPRIAAAGALHLLPSLGVLVLAWMLGSILQDLQTARFLADLLGDHLPLSSFPAAIFVVGCLASFVSGTSWGTMALLMPLALPSLGPLAAAQGAPPEAIVALVPTVIAAVFGGAVFGDHCSPFSDTTIVSALSCGVSTPAHTLTQLPYALIAATVSLLCGYLPIASGLNHWLALLAGSAALLAIVLFVPAQARRDRPLPVD